MPNINEFKKIAFHYGFYGAIHATYEPAQIVVTSRLPEGEYEAFKVLAKNASKEDILKVLQLAEDNPEPQMIDYVRAVLTVSSALNENLIEEIKEGGVMNEAVRRIFAEEIALERQEGWKEGIQEGRKEGILETLTGLVQKGLLSLSDAAKEAGLSPAEFQAKTAGLK